MLLKAEVQETCGECGRYKRTVSPEQHGCDQCKKPIVPYGNDERLDVTVFYLNDRTEHFYFCSWHCVFVFVKKIKTNHFFTLPYVCYDNKIVGRRASDFFKEVRKIRN
jgi:hypothetical protein